MGTRGIWLLLSMIGGVSCFLNSTPIVVLGAPVVRDVALALKQSPKRYLMPLSYITVLTGCCTLIGTSTNLLVDDMASVAGQARFGIFERSEEQTSELQSLMRSSYAVVCLKKKTQT